MKKSFPKTSKQNSKVDVALKKIRKIEKEFKPELKFVDSYLAPDTVANTSGGEILSFIGNPIQGIGESDRIGNEILCKKIYHGMEFTGSESCRIRMLIFRDTRRSYNTVTNSLPNINILDVLQYPTYPMISPLQESQNQRFKVMYDRVLNYDSSFNGKVTIKKWFKVNKHIKYPIDSGDDATVNGFYMLLVTDASSAPSYISYSRMYYTDA